MKSLAEKTKTHAVQRRDTGNTRKRAVNLIAFADHRQETPIHKHVQLMADRSPQAAQIAKLQHMANSVTPNRTGLPNNLKAGIENLSGYTMDDVRVHYNSDKPAQLHAHAYAQGTDIHIASGQEKHLPHEAWHVVQQKQGRVKPTMQMKAGVNVNDDAGLEKDADAMGAKAMSMQDRALQMKADEGHSHGCGCATCSGAISSVLLRKKMTAHTDRFATQIVQRCPKCANPACKRGEVCKQGDDLGGLFDSSTKADAVKFYNEKQGHEGKPTQWEHPLPGSAMRQSGLGGHYSSSPVVQMPTPVHRDAIDGMGGGVTSTGSSHTAVGWSAHLANTVKSDGKAEAIRQALADDVNAYASKGQLKEDHKSTFVQLIRGYVEKGMITHVEGDQVGAAILAQIDNWLKRMK